MIEVKRDPLPLPLQEKQHIRQNQTADVDPRRLKLKKATQAFEAIFVAQLLKSMRSISFNKEENGFGKDIMLSIADESVSQQLAKDGMLGIGSMLYNHLVQRIDEADEQIPQLKLAEVAKRKLELPHLSTPLNHISKATVHSVAKQPPHPAAPHQITPKKEVVQPMKVSAIPNILSAHATTNTTAPVQQAASEKQVANNGGDELPALKNYIDHIREAASETDLPESLLKSMIMKESSGNPYALSGRGAAGLMQLMPDTAKSVGVSDRFDPKQNILGGARYMRQLLDRFGDLGTALAAYNAGPGNVIKHGGIPPFSETKDYVKGILSDLTTAKRVK